MQWFTSLAFTPISDQCNAMNYQSSFSSHPWPVCYPEMKWWDGCLLTIQLFLPSLTSDQPSISASSLEMSWWDGWPMTIQISQRIAFIALRSPVFNSCNRDTFIVQCPLVSIKMLPNPDDVRLNYVITTCLFWNTPTTMRVLSTLSEHVNFKILQPRCAS